MATLRNYRMTCDFYALTRVDNDGSPVTQYVKVNSHPVKCNLDLTLSRGAKDALWTATVARPTDRTGILMVAGDSPTPPKTGYRVKMVTGPKGVFHIQGSVDEAWGANLSHYEAGVVEVSSLQYRGDMTNGGGK